MPIPEALAIATTTTAIYSFIRTSIDTIIRDRDKWKGEQKALKQAERLLNSIETRLRSWHEQWMVTTESSVKAKAHNALLYEEFWKAQCSHIEGCCENIQNEVNDFKPWFDKELERAGSWTGKVKHMIRSKDKLDSVELKLPSLMTFLETESLSRFRIAHPDLLDRPVTPDEIYKFARSYLLLGLARSSFDASRKLHNSCTVVANGHFSLYLVLDFLDSITQGETDAIRFEICRRRALAKAGCNNQYLDFVFITKERTWGVCMRTSVHPQTTAPDNSKMSLLEASNYVFGEPTPITHGTQRRLVESGFVSSPPGYHFSVRNDLENDGRYKQVLNDRTINQALATQDLDSLGFVRMSTTSLKQAEILYRLAECGLLLLKTPWFIQICSCRIFHRARELVHGIPQIQQRRYPQQYVFRQGPRPAGNGQPPRCFCLNPPDDAGCLFHLGILLMEIALGTPVSDIHVPDPAIPNANPWGIPHSILFQPGKPLHIDPLKSVLDRTSGTIAIGNAVAHCLRSQARENSITEDDLADYYEQVLEP